MVPAPAACPEKGWRPCWKANGHLYERILASNFLMPMQIPAALAADA